MCRVGLIALVAFTTQWPAPEQQRVLTPPPIVSHKITVLRDWVRAVRRHVPGETDAALLSVVAWSRDEVLSAWVDVQTLVAVVKDKDVNGFYLYAAGERKVLRTFLSRQDLEALRDLAHDVRDGEGLTRFVKRAAILHSDIAQQFQGDAEAVSTSSMWSPRRFVVQTEDGQQTGINGGIIHWDFGRFLIDQVPEAGRDEFARSWYRASLAFKLAVADLDTPHFVHAIEIFPNDAVMRFLKGSLHDAFAHAAVQSVVGSARLPPRAQLEVQSEVNELRQAEAEYRRAIEQNREFGEARLRRGRVLARQGRHADAAEELQRTLALVREPLLEYYARLFLGAAREALGGFDDASAAYGAAATLYPHAQAPRIALSQLAHRTGNRAAARRALEDMLQPSRAIEADDDPWWLYQSVPGRMADEWREATYRLLPQ